MKGSDFFMEAAKRPPFSKLHPMMASFFRDYLAHEKVVRFQDKFVLNTHFPPYPSLAFDCLVENFSAFGESHKQQLYSVTIAVTNRCNFHCWHCYNAGRSTDDISFETFRQLAGDLQGMGAVMITLTGGEPLLREDLEEIVGMFDERSCLILGTTGSALTSERARKLRDEGLFGVGISLDSTFESEHDRLRGWEGAFQVALRGIHIASEAGLYPYVVSVATHEFLRPEHFWSFMQLASEAGALEVHLLEPCATGRLAGCRDALLSGEERNRIIELQKEVARNDNLPILSSYAYLESADAFGCGAGLTHLYVDGSGEVCPCQLVPTSLGNVRIEPLPEILNRMGRHFRKPRAACTGKVLAKHIPTGPLPTSPATSTAICTKHLPRKHKVPRFFKVRQESQAQAGLNELRTAYDQVHGDYDEFWLKEAAKPIEELVARLPLADITRAFEAGCGTGYATALLSRGLAESAEIVAVDISEGMLGEARNRVAAQGLHNVKFLAGDALKLLRSEGPFDLVFSSWVLGYIPLRAFFSTVKQGLIKNGSLAFVVHKENSPKEALEIFGEIVGRDPSVLRKRVAFDFPRSTDHITFELERADLEVVEVWEGSVTFQYDEVEQVLQHLLKSGAGTAFYDALDPERRADLQRDFLEILADRNRPGGFKVVHDFVASIAKNP